MKLSSWEQQELSALAAQPTEEDPTSLAGSPPTQIECAERCVAAAVGVGVVGGVAAAGPDRGGPDVHDRPTDRTGVKQAMHGSGRDRHPFTAYLLGPVRRSRRHRARRR